MRKGRLDLMRAHIPWDGLALGVVLIHHSFIHGARGLIIYRLSIVSRSSKRC